MPTPARGPRSFLLLVGAAYLALGVSLTERESPFFRPWERVLTADGAGFRPGVSVSMLGCGDLGHATWQRRRRVWREQTFTTDAAGYRNPPFAALPRVVVVGDSYVAGAALDDRETISAALGRALGEDVYNYGRPFGLAPLVFMQDPRFVERPPRVLVWVASFRSCPDGLSLERPEQPTEGAAAPGVEAVLAPVLAPLRRLDDAFDSALEVSRLVRWSRVAYNEGRDALLGGWVAPLREVRWRGRPMLTLGPPAQRYSPRAVTAEADRLALTVARWRDALAARGTRLVFAPVPEPATTLPELYSPRDLGSGEPLHAASLAAARARGVDAIDLVPALRGLGGYPYQADDSHWSPRAVEAAAQAIAATLRRADRARDE